jgi:ElaB/YqjD/DUF883 family membrane-anchored ribosome-binding protein
MKAEILEKTSEYLGGTAHVAAKAGGVVVDGAMVAKDAAVDGAKAVKVAAVSSAKAVKVAAVHTYGAAGSAVSATGRQIRRKPLVSVLVAIGAGFVFGLLIGRKTKG